MAKIVFFSPREEMIIQAHEVIQKLDIKDVEVKLVATATAVDEARKAEELGAEIIIARGNQASLIRRYTDIPVVEIALTAQEMGLIIKQAKAVLNKSNPFIANVGFGNMFCDTRYFNEVFDIQFKNYYVKYSEELDGAVEEAIKDGPDLIIGGDIVTDYASKLGIPNLFISSTEDSIQQAFRVAASVAYASDLEKKNSAELRTLLDFSFNGIIKLNSEGEVVALNHLAETLLRKSSADAVGHSILELFTPLEQHQLDQVLIDGQEVFSAFLNLHGVEVAVNLAPIKLENQVVGAILSCHEVKKLNELEAEARRELYLQGRVPKYTFEWMEQNLELDTDFIKSAKRFAQSDAPLIISGESNIEAEILAQSIHNGSLRKAGPYVSSRCSAYSDKEQLVHLFGSGSGALKNGVIAGAHNGTLFIDEISQLNSHAQYRLLKLIVEQILIRDNDNRPLPVNVRVVAATNKNLWTLVEEGKFRRDLYYALSTLSLSFLPLRERKEDIGKLIDHYIKEYSEVYSRYIVLTKGAMAALIDYPWDGNTIQLKSFSERLVLSSTKRSVDEIMISKMLNEAYPIVYRRKTNEPIVIFKDPEAATIAELLEKHNGSRSLVAEELNISTTTLWRKMKKYQITGKFEA